jgi:hypothetical protein
MNSVSHSPNLAVVGDSFASAGSRRVRAAHDVFLVDNGNSAIDRACAASCSRNPIQDSIRDDCSVHVPCSVVRSSRAGRSVGSRLFVSRVGSHSSVGRGWVLAYRDSVPTTHGWAFQRETKLRMIGSVLERLPTKDRVHQHSVRARRVRQSLPSRVVATEFGSS